MQILGVEGRKGFWAALSAECSSVLFAATLEQKSSLPGKGERGKEDGGKGGVQAEFAVKHSRPGAFPAHPEGEILEKD